MFTSFRYFLFSVKVSHNIHERTYIYHSHRAKDTNLHHCNSTKDLCKNFNCKLTKETTMPSLTSTKNIWRPVIEFLKNVKHNLPIPYFTKMLFITRTIMNILN